MKFYHVDRWNSLQTLGELSFIQTNLPFDLGFNISSHGVSHFCRNIVNWSEIYELALEFVRTTKFPQFPSRFKCFFAHKTQESAYGWAIKYLSVNKEFQIAEVESDTFFEFDCSWFTPIKGKTVIQLQSVPQTLSAACEISNNYWSGKKTNTPNMEILIPLPCNIVNLTKHIIRTSVRTIIPSNK